MPIQHGRLVGLLFVLVVAGVPAGARQTQGPPLLPGRPGETPFGGAREVVVPEGGTEVPLQRLDGFYFVDVTMNGQPFRFTLETGANLFAISQRAADRLGLKPLVGAQGGMPRVGVTSLRIGAAEFRGLTAAVSPGFQQMQPDFDGIVSIPILRSLHVTLDFPARTMRVDRELVLPDPDERDVLRVLRPELGNRADISVSFAGRTFAAVIDTRSSIWFMVPESEGRDLPFHGAIQSAGGARGPTMGAFSLSRGNLDGDFRLGRYTVERPTVYLRDRPGTVIGMPLLEKFVLTLELAQGRVRFAHPAGDVILADGSHTTVSAPDGPSMGFGLGIAPGRGPTVAVVFAGSDAEVKGLRVGDTLVEFDGKPASEMSRELLRAAATGARPIRMVVTRDGKRLEFTVMPFGPRAPLPAGR